MRQEVTDLARLSTPNGQVEEPAFKFQILSPQILHSFHNPLAPL